MTRALTSPFPKPLVILRVRGEEGTGNVEAPNELVASRFCSHGWRNAYQLIIDSVPELCPRISENLGLAQEIRMMRE